MEWRRMERTGLRQAQQARLPLYERTRVFRAYPSWLVPGMIQTPAFTEAALRAVQQRRGLVDDVADAVAARLERQKVLHEGDHRFAFLVEESVLRSGLVEGIDGALVAHELAGQLTARPDAEVTISIGDMSIDIYGVSYREDREVFELHVLADDLADAVRNLARDGLALERTADLAGRSPSAGRSC